VKKYLLPILALSLLLNVSVKAEDTVFKTYIVAGQSNANGYGLGSGDLYSGTLIPSQNLTELGRSDLATSQSTAYIFKGGNDSGLGEWANLAPGYGTWNGVRFGPELSFSKQFQSSTGAKVAIIKYSPDGTSLYTDWNPNAAETNRYDYFLKTVKNAKTAAASRGWSLEISGVLWMQGESDSFGTDAPAAYEQNLGTFITKVRDDLSLPDLAFHIGQIADTTTWPGRQQIWDAQESVATADTKAYLVNGKDLPLFTNDGLGLNNTHYTTEGTITLGERFASSVVNTEMIAAYPESSPDNVTTVPGQAITIDVLRNDTGAGLKINDINPWSLRGGNVAIINNKLSYIPGENVSGEDKIWYEFEDSLGRTNSGEVTITIAANAPFPVAVTEAVSATKNTAKIFDALGNDIGVQLSINEVNDYSVNGGRVAVIDGKLRYTPKPNYTGSDSFWYAIKDYRGLTNAIEVTVTISN